MSAKSSDDDLLDEYVLSSQLLTDGEPIRCVTTSSSSSDAASLELLSGSQGGVVSRILLSDATKGGSGAESDSDKTNEPLLEIQPGGANTRHPHQITAILSSSGDRMLYATGCKDGNVRIMDGKSHELKYTLEGHSNAVTSLSWINGADDESAPWLVSGSWDGTAKIWSITSEAYACLGTLSGHENTVSVAGLPAAESNGARRVVTVSAGVAEGNAIRGHTVRIWNLTPSPDGSMVKSEIVNQVANDHSGPMRDVVYDADTGMIYTCSNDGTVKIRSPMDGKCISTLAYPGGDRPMFLSLCLVGDWKTKAVVAGAEDGNVVVWDVSSNGTNRDPQVIAHPGCVWRVAPVHNSQSTSEFITACNDGHLRIFTRHASKMASASVLDTFSKSVTEAMASRSTGPSPEEIAKLPQWEMNSLTQGRSEGQVQVFQRNGKAIAAQWSATSRTWIEVGEVTGQNTNAGTLNGKRYDHVLPIEIDTTGGGVAKLQIGYNNGENPFVVAQAFIDEHMLDQGYLAEIADYIRQRAGESGPTLGGGGGGGGGGASSYAAPSSSVPAPMEGVTPTYDHLPMRGYKIFGAGVDNKGLTKVLGKVREFNAAVASDKQLTSMEAVDVLDSLVSTLAVTNRYHSSSVSDVELGAISKMITGWGPKHAFPALDLARMAVLHPDAASSKRKVYWEEVLRGALDTCLGLGDGAATEVAVPMLTMRLVANSFKGGIGAAGAAGSLMDKILECANACAPSNNKNVRLSVATAVLNASSYMHASSTPISSSSAILILDVVGTIVGCGKYEPEPIVRSLVALGTTLLISGSGAEVQRVAKERGIGSMVQGVMSSDHGNMSKAVANEILLILS
eukprot:CAMPEP_0183713124 /NCGR_PEP_ID=MMETSP0737-20130205/8078_1 /TAXON_ID=385413 /ORGANISM="Thalassiosira miniscula, Strain CCMP1093" /LENGTH=848 /DNA_ID=CAMNT_0025941873 /DNA_START=41 /DNA_END=2590 /DNA_ORIENTATION=-